MKLFEQEKKRFAELEGALCKAFRVAVPQVQQKHRGEKIYAYILFTSPSLTYAAMSFNTEEALRRTAQTEKDQSELRWVPSEWPYNGEGEVHFKPADSILNSLAQLPDAYEDAGRNNRWHSFVNALKRLDGDGIFGTGAARERVLVNVMWGDLDLIAHVQSARELNPKASYLWYAADALPTLRNVEKEIKHSRSMFKEESLARIRGVIRQVEADLGKRS